MVSRTERDLQRMRERFTAAVETPGHAARAQSNGHGLYERHVSNGNGHSRPTYNGLGVIEEEEVHVVVHTNGHSNGHSRSGNGHLQSAGAR